MHVTMVRALFVLHSHKQRHKKKGVILQLVHFFLHHVVFFKLASCYRFLAAFIVISVTLLRAHMPMFNVKTAICFATFLGSSFSFHRDHSSDNLIEWEHEARRKELWRVEGSHRN